MTEQEKLLDIQFKVAPKCRVLDIISIVFMLLVIYALSILTVVIPDNEFSEQENRYLQTFPELNVGTLTSGQFTSEIADYYADQLPLRNMFVGIKGVAEMALLKQENNDVVAASDGYIVKRVDIPDKEIIEKNMNGIMALSPALEQLGIPYTVALAGRPSDELEPYMPALFPNDLYEDNWNYVLSLFANDSYIRFVDMRKILADRIAENVGNDDDSAQMLYRTDHHWTVYGAYLGYTEIMAAMGQSANEYAHYIPELVSDSFFGTTWSSAGMKWIKPDSMYYLRYEGDDTDYTTTIVDTGASFTGFYDRSYLEKKDKYSSYIGGNNARVDVVKTANVEADRKKMVIIKDSYAHSLAPFLAEHYDLIILDPRYVKDSIIEIIDNEGADEVLVMYYLGSLTDTNVTGMLKMGVSKYTK